MNPGRQLGGQLAQLHSVQRLEPDDLLCGGLTRRYCLGFGAHDREA
jgi:hypothetical protein